MQNLLQSQGFALVTSVLAAEEIEHLREEVPHLTNRHRGGARNLLSQSSQIASLAVCDKVKPLADEALQGDAFPVRALFFDKVADANWKVPWHQDITIAVRERKEDVPGFSGWSLKDGVLHVHPPVKILERMVSLRLHLDRCGPDNGPLRVISGSHLQGLLNPTQIESFRRLNLETVCCAEAGDVLLMRPLILHASSSAACPSHRRVIHIEYACDSLPSGLQWHESLQTQPALTLHT